MVERLDMPGVVQFFAVLGYVAAGGFVVFALVSFSGDGPVGGVAGLLTGLGILVGTLLFVAIYQSIRDHGRFLGARLDLQVQQQTEVMRRLRGIQEMMEWMQATPTPSPSVPPAASSHASEQAGDAHPAPSVQAPVQTRAMRCPKCSTVNPIPGGQTPACRSCGFA